MKDSYICNYSQFTDGVKNFEPNTNGPNSLGNRSSVIDEKFFCIKPHLQYVVYKSKKWSERKCRDENGNKSILQHLNRRTFVMNKINYKCGVNYISDNVLYKCGITHFKVFRKECMMSPFNELVVLLPLCSLFAPISSTFGCSPSPPGISTTVILINVCVNSSYINFINLPDFNFSHC